MAYTCPKGHDSTDADYCSECGALIGQTSVIKDGAAAGAAPGAGDACPDCGTPRTPGSRFCELCRYDFQNKTSHTAAAPSTAPAVAAAMAEPVVEAPDPAAVNAQSPVADAPAVPLVGDALVAPDTLVAPVAAPIPSGTIDRLDIVVIVDPSRATGEEAEKACPRNAPERIFPLDLDENLLGRRSDKRGIYPEVDISDPGVSHRHLKFIKQVDGSFAVLELGSANGTELNGAALEPGVPVPVKAGDEFFIGMWTRLRLSSRGTKK